MRIVVLGAGALGSILAAHLARAGDDVTLIARGARAKLIDDKGVAIAGLAKFTVPVRVVVRTHELSDVDVLILAVKTYSTEAALEGVAHLKPGLVLSVQNGVLKNEQLARVFGRQATLGASADFSGEVMPDGTALFTRNEGFYIGEPAGGVSDRVQALADVLNAAGIRTIASAKIQTIEWSKYVAWLSLTPLALLSRLETHRILQDPDLARLQVMLSKEGALLAGALDIEIEDLIAIAPARVLSTLSEDEAVAVLRKNGEMMEERGVTSHKMSALQDLERGRRLEVEETFGYAVRKASELSVPVPVLETCYGLVAALDRAVRGAA